MRACISYFSTYFAFTWYTDWSLAIEISLFAKSGVSVRLRELGRGEYIKANRSSTGHFARNIRDA